MVCSFLKYVEISEYPNVSVFYSLLVYTAHCMYTIFIATRDYPVHNLISGFCVFSLLQLSLSDSSNYYPRSSGSPSNPRYGKSHPTGGSGPILCEGYLKFTATFDQVKMCQVQMSISDCSS